MGTDAKITVKATMMIAGLLALAGCGIPAVPASESRWWNGGIDSGYTSQPEPVREPANVPELADTWIGATKHELVGEWGPPDRLVDSPGHPWRGYFYGNRRMAGYDSAYRPGTRHDITFWIDERGIVQSWRHRARWRGQV